MSYNKESTGNAFSSFLAIIPSLAQVVAVIAIAFTDKLGLSKILIKPDLIPLMNVLAILLSLSLIGFLTLWKENSVLKSSVPATHGKIMRWFKKWFVDDLQSPKMPFQVFQSRFGSLIWILFILQIISFLGFIISIFIDRYSAFIQLVSYVAFLTLSAGLIFTWAKEITDKSKQFKVDDFMPNLQSTLLSYGILNNTLKVGSNTDIGNSRRLVKASIAEKDLYFIVSFDGKQIFYEIDDASYKEYFKLKKE
jgi:hypothetical protein